MEQTRCSRKSNHVRSLVCSLHHGDIINDALVSINCLPAFLKFALLFVISYTSHDGPISSTTASIIYHEYDPKTTCILQFTMK